MVTKTRKDGTIPHGGAGTGYANYGCRCLKCTEANTLRAKREARSRLFRLEVDPTLARHGTRSTYQNWHCRCGPCTDANTVSCNAYKKRTGRRK